MTGMETTINPQTPLLELLKYEQRLVLGTDLTTYLEKGWIVLMVVPFTEVEVVYREDARPQFYLSGNGSGGSHGSPGSFNVSGNYGSGSDTVTLKTPVVVQKNWFVLGRERNSAFKPLEDRIADLEAKLLAEGRNRDDALAHKEAAVKTAADMLGKQQKAEQEAQTLAAKLQAERDTGAKLREEIADMAREIAALRQQLKEREESDRAIEAMTGGPTLRRFAGNGSGRTAPEPPTDEEIPF